MIPSFQLRKNLSPVDIATVQANPTRLPLAITTAAIEKVAAINADKRDTVRKAFSAALRKPFVLR